MFPEEVLTFPDPAGPIIICAYLPIMSLIYFLISLIIYMSRTTAMSCGVKFTTVSRQRSAALVTAVTGVEHTLRCIIYI